MFASCCHHSCLTLPHQGARVILEDLILPETELRGNGCGLAFQLMQGNELSGWFSFHFWKDVHTETLNSRACISILASLVGHFFSLSVIVLISIL